MSDDEKDTLIRQLAKILEHEREDKARKNRNYQTWYDKQQRGSTEHDGYFHNPERKKAICQRNILANLELKKEAIQQYGPSCACCGETRIEFLTFDHLGDARQLLGHIKWGPQRFLRDLKSRGWPSGIRVLCANCHIARNGGRTCPHL